MITLKRLKKMGIIILIIGVVISELIVGLPFGRFIATGIARSHVRETYGFTPRFTNPITDAVIFLHFHTRVVIEVEEQPFSFEVQMSRWAIPPIFVEITDTYLERKVEYILTRDLRAYVEEVTNGQGRVWGSLVIGRASVRNQVSLSELEENPNLAFERLQGDYRIGISLYGDIYDIDYNLIYGIYSRMFEFGLLPHGISFFLRCEEEREEARLRIILSGRRVFAEINSVDDFRRVFEEERRRR